MACTSQKDQAMRDVSALEHAAWKIQEAAEGLQAICFPDREELYFPKDIVIGGTGTIRGRTATKLNIQLQQDSHFLRPEHGFNVFETALEPGSELESDGNLAPGSLQPPTRKSRRTGRTSSHFSGQDILGTEHKVSHREGISDILYQIPPSTPSASTASTSARSPSPQPAKPEKTRNRTGARSPHFSLPSPPKPPAQPALKKPKPKPTPKLSPHFSKSVLSPPITLDPFSLPSPPTNLPFILQPAPFGLIQERIADSLYALVVQAILWNKTKGIMARPILFNLLSHYPTPESLAEANEEDVEAMIRTLGLQKRRAKTLVSVGKAWVERPPEHGKRYGRRNYPSYPHSRSPPASAVGKYKSPKDGELLEEDDQRDGWEIAHLPGIGEYALDSYRIFGRDRLRGFEGIEGIEPEWKRVTPRDKELAPYVRWKWAQEGWEYDIATGTRRKVGVAVLRG